MNFPSNFLSFTSIHTDIRYSTRLYCSFISHSHRILVKEVQSIRKMVVNHPHVDEPGGEIYSISITFSIRVIVVCRWGIQLISRQWRKITLSFLSRSHGFLQWICNFIGLLHYFYWLFPGKKSHQNQSSICHPLFRKWFLGFLVSIAFILVDIISTSVIISQNDYDHGILSDFYLNQSNSSHNYMNDVYVKPWCRIGPYAIGLFIGYILYHRYQRSNTLSWEFIVPERRSTRANRIQQIVAWIFALLFLSLCVFGTFGDYHDRPLTRSGRITFLVLSRMTWSIGLSIIIISCFLRQESLVNKLLGHRFFALLGRLTYGAYLWHSLVLVVHYLSRDQPVHYTLANIVCFVLFLLTHLYLFSF